MQRESTQIKAAELSEDLKRDVSLVAAFPSIAKILAVACQITEMGFSVVARVTDTHWVACAVHDDIHFGLKAGEQLPLQTTICQSIRQKGRAVIINHVDEDPFYSTHQTPFLYGFQSYISVPIFRRSGELFGTLCAIDPNPKNVNVPGIEGTFMLFAQMIAQYLDNQDSAEYSELKLKKALDSGQAREEHLAILGHDLRNPVSAISHSAQMLNEMELSDDARQIAGVIKRSSFRISELIDNVLDFSRVRFGKGLTIQPVNVDHPILNLAQVVNELQTVWPGRKIQTDFSVAVPIVCDMNRVSQLFSNLLANALTYGDPRKPIQVRARVIGIYFELSVINKGPVISRESMRRLFDPFSRGVGHTVGRGLGLGLYIAHVIAKAHHGDIRVHSENDETEFTFCMPVLS